MRTIADVPSERAMSERISVEAASPAAVEPVTIVIFGGAGDLAHRKLLPALYNLHVDGLLPAHFGVVGIGRRAMTDDAYRNFAREGIDRFSRRQREDGPWQAFAGSLFF